MGVFVDASAEEINRVAEVNPTPNLLTGSLMWGRATEDERHGVVAAFASASCNRYDTVLLSTNPNPN